MRTKVKMRPNSEHVKVIKYLVAKQPSASPILEQVLRRMSCRSASGASALCVDCGDAAVVLVAGIGCLCAAR